MSLYSIFGDGLTQKAIDEAVRQTNEMGIAMITLP
jgi:hypothetical protein